MPRTATASTQLAVPASERARLARGEHHDPHALLGAHPTPAGTVVRAFHPEATSVDVLPEDAPRLSMSALGDGFWAALLPGVEPPVAYRLRFTFARGASWERDDPYRFPPTIEELDLHLIAEGSHERLYDVLGAHSRTVEGTSGVAFAVWAPNARSVRLVGDFSRWDGRLSPGRPDLRRVTTLGSFHPDKDQLEQIEVARRMPDWTFTLLGSPAAPRYARKVQREASRTPNLEVVLNPTKERIEQEFSRSSHFLHSNPHEGFGIAVVEAAAAGCVPVVPDTGGVREIVEAEELRFADVDECVEALRGSTGEAGRRLLIGVQRGMRRFGVASFRSAMARAIGVPSEADHAMQGVSAAT